MTSDETFDSTMTFYTKPDYGNPPDTTDAETVTVVGFDGSRTELPTHPRPIPSPVPRVPWGPTGETVYKRTYSRVKPDGGRETWPETVERVVNGNLALGDHRHELPGEHEALSAFMREFKIIPAGRHLWASGVRGRQYLFNCHVSHWSDDPAEHFRFSFLRLMEGGGVGANYSNKYLQGYAPVRGPHRVHIVCDPEHPDYEKMREAGVLSTEYNWDWPGAFDVEDSREGWADALVDLLSTYYRDADNANRVFDVSRVRAEGARLKTFGGRASGPLPLGVMLREVADIMNGASGDRLDGIRAMGIDHAVAKCVVSGGNRRSARMAIMHWADPQIKEFIHAKADGLNHWTTNISVEVDDHFFVSADAGAPDAVAVLNAIADGMVNNGEPGFWNSSLSNVGEPNRVVCTNPCGEIALEPWENCNLGHVNLSAFVNRDGSTDTAGLHYAHKLMTRFLIRATHGDVTDDKQAATLARNRRIGVGHLGVASYLALKGHRYEVAFGSEFGELLTELSHTVDDEAVDYSHALRTPVPVKSRTVAPTGSIAKMPGVSEGIHPIFAKYFIRRVRFSKVDPDQMRTVEGYREAGYHVEDDRFASETVVVSIPTMDTLVGEVAARYGAESADRIVQSAEDCSLEGMLTFQAQYQRLWADNAVSYTVNFDPGRYSAGHVANVLRTWGPSLKGATLFPEASYDQAPYERITKEKYLELSERTGSYVEADSVDEECVSGACPIK